MPTPPDAPCCSGAFRVHISCIDLLHQVACAEALHLLADMKWRVRCGVGQGAGRAWCGRLVTTLNHKKTDCTAKSNISKISCEYTVRRQTEAVHRALHARPVVEANDENSENSQLVIGAITRRRIGLVRRSSRSRSGRCFPASLPSIFCFGRHVELERSQEAQSPCLVPRQHQTTGSTQPTLSGTLLPCIITASCEAFESHELASTNLCKRKPVGGNAGRARFHSALSLELVASSCTDAGVTSMRRFRRTGVMRGTEAARVRGVASAWDPERAAKRASERSTRSGLHNGENGITGEHERLAAKMREKGIKVTASDLDREAYKDVRYRSHDKVCPVCRSEVPPALSLGGDREMPEHPTQQCLTPEEAYMDSRYREGDAACPVCHGWLPQKRTGDDGKTGEASDEKDAIRVWGQPDRWRKAGKGELWKRQGLHMKNGRATEKQRIQEIVPHSETDPERQYELGCKLEAEGDKASRPNVDRAADLEQAAGWFRSAAFQGHAKALYRLGLCYLHAKGVRKDLRQGMSLLRKAAAEEGDAAYELGWCYHRGIGAAVDQDQALGWWRIALGMGHLKALEAINQSSESSDAKAERSMTALLRYKAGLGDREAQYAVACRLFQGHTVIKDEAQAAHYYQLAASQGHVEAMCAIGLCYYYGRGVQTDQERAVTFLKRAAQLGHGIAQSALAYMHDDGIAVPRDQDRARVLRREAAKWEQRRVSAFYRKAAQGTGGNLLMGADSLLSYVDYVRRHVEQLRAYYAASILVRHMLGSALTRSYRARKFERLLTTLESPHMWRAARLKTWEAEKQLQSMHEPACILLGQDPRVLSLPDTSNFLKDLNDMEAVGLEKGAGGEVQVSWDREQVKTGELKVGDAVEFVVGYSRDGSDGGKMTALSLLKTYDADAPPPGTLLVLPAGTGAGLRSEVHVLHRDIAKRNHEIAKAGVSMRQQELDEHARRARELKETERKKQASQGVDASTSALVLPPHYLPPQPDMGVPGEGGENRDATEGEEAGWQEIPAFRMVRGDAPADNTDTRSCFVDTQLSHIAIRGALPAKRLALAREHEKRASEKKEYAEQACLEQEKALQSGSASGVFALAHQRGSMMNAVGTLALSRGMRARGRVASVSAGDRDAQLEYGLRLFAGCGVDKRRDLAVTYFKKSSEQGQALADCALAVCWALGEGVAYADNRQAAVHLQRALRAGIPLASALQADIMGNALDKSSMLARLDALRSTLTVQTKIDCISKNMALNHLGELYAHSHDSLPITRSGPLRPPAPAGVLGLASGIHALSAVEESDRGRDHLVGKQAVGDFNADSPSGTMQYVGEFASGKVRLGGEEPWRRGRAWWEKPHPLPLSDSRAMRLFKAALTVPAGRTRFAPALNNLGEMHELGRHGRAPDEDKAYSYYTAAADAAALSTSKEERYLSNIRALPGHMRGLPAQDFGDTDLVKELEKKLCVSLGLPH